MSLPAYRDLAGIAREQLWGLIEQVAGPVWAAPYEQSWQRSPTTWNAVVQALARAAAGERPQSPAARAPRFLGPMARERVTMLSTTWRQDGPFGEIRLLERLGLITLDHDDSYVLAVVGGLGDRWAAKDRAAMLRSDPELLELVWRFFEVEGGGEISLANVDKFSRDTSWKLVLAELVAEGTLPRPRVLACCLEALGRDFSAYRAGWFSTFLDCLAPRPDELAPWQPQLRRLLASPVTATAALAGRALTAVATAGLLDDDSCAELAPGLVGRTKGTALQVLRLLRDVARRRPDLGRPVAQTAAAALAHPHADVQRAAVALLADLGATDLATAAADALAPTVRQELERRTPATPTAPAAPATSAAPAASPAPDDGDPAPDDDPARADVLRPVDLAPHALTVPSGPDLVDAVAALLEDAEDPPAVEAALAGLAAVGEPDLPAPLARRAATLLRRDGFAADHPVRAGFALLIQVSAGTADVPAPDQAGDLPALLRARLHHVATILAGRAPRGPLLAMPTDTDGWVCPETFVARLAAGPEPHPADLVGALFRLAPQGRPAALDAFTAQGRTDETGDVVRHALGAPPPAAGAAAVRAHAGWVAASRARDPLSEDPLLLAAGLTGPGQGRPVRARLELRDAPFTYQDARGTHTVRHSEFAVVMDAAAPGAPRDAAPAPTHPDRLERFRTDLPTAWVRWAATTQPHDTEPVFSRLVLNVVDALEYGEVDHTIPRALVALANHPGRVGPLGAITAAAGMAAQDRTHRVLGVDAVVALAGRGTLPPGELATAMQAIAAATRLPRWAPSLEQLARAVGGGYVVDALTRLLPQLPRDGRGLATLLEVLTEESTRITRPMTDPALRGYLASFTGSGAAARAARRALAVR